MPGAELYKKLLKTVRTPVVAVGFHSNRKDKICFSYRQNIDDPFYLKTTVRLGSAIEKVLSRIGLCDSKLCVKISSFKGVKHFKNFGVCDLHIIPLDQTG